MKIVITWRFAMLGETGTTPQRYAGICVQICFASQSISDRQDHEFRLSPRCFYIGPSAWVSLQRLVLERFPTGKEIYYWDLETT